MRGPMALLAAGLAVGVILLGVGETLARGDEHGAISAPDAASARSDGRFMILVPDVGPGAGQFPQIPKREVGRGAMDPGARGDADGAPADRGMTGMMGRGAGSGVLNGF